MACTSSSSSWMLPLLLLSLFVSIHQSSSESSGQTTTKICSTNEFNASVRHLEVALKNCDENCSLVPISSKTCQCFNLSVSLADHGLSSYFTRGLKSLHLKPGRPQNSVRALVKILSRNFKDFEINVVALKIKNETSISPKSFVESLDRLVKLINSMCA